MADAITRNEGAKAALLDYRQADMDGIFVTVSRQAIHEVVDALVASEARIRELETAAISNEIRFVRIHDMLQSLREREGVEWREMRGGVNEAVYAIRGRAVVAIGKRCARCGSDEVRVNLDGDDLCQQHADAWVIGEGNTAIARQDKAK